MAKVPEITPATRRREALVRESERLRGELISACDALETPAAVVDTGRYYGGIALDAWKFAAPFRELFVQRKWTSLPGVWRNATLGWQLWNRRGGRKRY